MTHAKIKSVAAGTLLGGLLLIGTSGLALANDPDTTPAPSAVDPTPWAGMMNGAGMGAGNMDAGMGAGMMNGAAGMGAGMMNGAAGMGAGMMNGAAGMGAADMEAMHATMTDQGHCADQQGNGAAQGSKS